MVALRIVELGHPVDIQTQMLGVGEGGKAHVHRFDYLGVATLEAENDLLADPRLLVHLLHGLAALFSGQTQQIYY